MIGSVLDKYEVLQKLGEGATATVYRGRHMAIGKDVAIKVLHPHLSASSRYRERFNREARAVGRLAHQNIVSILDYSGQNADECYIVTELVDGMTLQGLLTERGRLPSEIAAILGAELAAALAFAHTAGVIHRDIKPENVMIRRDGRVKLMDFGVARVLDESSITLDGSLLGSPAYMSPQQALDEPLDGRSDLFSLGSMLFHAVTGHVPFSGTNASVILRNIIEGNRPEVLELAPGASPALAAVIDRLLQPKPEGRFASALEAQVALDACVRESGLSLDHPTINLRAYVVDPEACEQALQAHLRTNLLTVGKERLATGDTLGALQLFNRLLAIDEDNAEVITLIQSLHSPPATRSERRLPLVIAGAAILLIFVGVTAWWAWPRTPEPPPPVTTAPVDVEAPATESKPDLTPPPSLPPASDPTPSEPGTDPRPVPEPRVRTARVEPAAAQLPTAVSALVDTQATVVIKVTEPIGEADVWLDGEKLGKRIGGKPSEWIGSETRPIRVPPGRHRFKLTSPYLEDWEEEIQLAAGEPKTLTPPLRRAKVVFTLNTLLPKACTLSVGGVDYRSLRTIEIREPNGLSAVFTCPEPLGTFTSEIKGTVPGGTYILPTALPAVP